MSSPMVVRTYEQKDRKGVIKLWKECGLVVEWNDPVADIVRKMEVNPDLFLVGEVSNDIIASVMGGYEGHRGWINYLAVLPELRRCGYGQIMMSEVEERIREKGCPKINLQVRSTNSDVKKFYSSIGYKVDEVISMGKRLVDDQGSAETFPGDQSIHSGKLERQGR